MSTHSETKHTPGPWLAYLQEGQGAQVVQAESREFIADCCGQDDALWPQDLANARLIAAAPELLEALDALYHADHAAQFPCTNHEEFRGVSDRLTQARALARAALAKAQGATGQGPKARP